MKFMNTTLFLKVKRNKNIQKFKHHRWCLFREVLIQTRVLNQGIY